MDIYKSSGELNVDKKKSQISEKIGISNYSSAEISSLENDPTFNKHLLEYSNLLSQNEKWVDDRQKENPNYFNNLASPQHPKFLVITCCDSRISVSDITLCHPGEVFSHRNIGNVVNAIDFNIQSVLQYAVEVLKVIHILVIGHTDCGAIKASYGGEYHGLIDHWLNSIKDVEKENKDLLDKIKYEKGDREMFKKLSELNVRKQVLNLCQTPVVQLAWHKKQELYVHGLIFNLDNGLLENLEIDQTEWEQIKAVYDIKFKDSV